MQLKAKDLCQAEKKTMGPWVGEFQHYYHNYQLVSKP